MAQTALVLFSGGQDSTTCLAWALSRYPKVETVGFDYGQRHRIELDCRPKIVAAMRQRFPDWAGRLGDDHMLDVSVLGQISDTALTSDVEIKQLASGLPSTFVPGRNLLFLTLAAALAYRRQADVLVGGMCETDYSGYPDCRQNTMTAMQLALRLGMESKLVIETPLMWVNKAHTWVMAEQLGGNPLVELIRTETHTCYKGDRTRQHDWGYGCGECPACDLRASGYREYAGSRAA
jgi:7-cyano-7-deazaguanine synthase